MRTLIFVVSMLVATSAFAGLSYDFSSTTSNGRNELAGRVIVDKSNLRIDFQKGDNLLFRDNTIVVSRDGGKTLLLIDPAKKTYSELNIEQFFSALGGIADSGSGLFDVSVRNQKVNVRPVGSGGVIEGHRTRKYLIDSSFDMKLKLLGEVTEMNVKTSSETWTTDRFSKDYVTFLQIKPYRSGISELDKFLEAQTKGLEGFPLKQIVKSSTTTDGHTETVTTTILIKNIKDVSASPKVFEVPRGYKKQGMPALGF